MNALSTPPPVTGERHVRDRLAAWIAGNRLPEPLRVHVNDDARAAFVLLRTTDDLVQWAVATGYDIRVNRDSGGVAMWLRDRRESDIWCRLDGVPVPVDVYGPHIPADPS